MRKSLAIIPLAIIQKFLGILADIILDVEERTAAAAFLNALGNKVIIELGFVSAEGIFDIGIAISVIGGIEDQGFKIGRNFHGGITAVVRKFDRMRTVLGD